MTLAEASLASPVVVAEVGGAQGFRRRLMELGLLPGTEVTLVRVAPFGDPIELLVRGSRISIRRQEARAIRVLPVGAEAPEASEQSVRAARTVASVT